MTLTKLCAITAKKSQITRSKKEIFITWFFNLFEMINKC